MSFIHPCFIRKNTPELRGYLQGLGYENQELYGVTNNVDYIACCNNEYFSNNSTWVEMLPYCGYIDCGLNEELFKAIAALKDDSDYLQWFTDGDKWEFCIEHKFSTNDINQCEGMCDLDLLLRHKATVEELIEKFK